jgi:hypothetical protein
MLFSIYLASLITFSSGMELSRRLVDPQLPHQIRCKLFVNSGGVAKGWIKIATDNTLTVIPDSQTAFSEAQEFQWGKTVQNGDFPTVYTTHMSPSLRLLSSGMLTGSIS